MFNLNGLQPAAVTNISLCFGLTITVLVYSFAGISGANLNPGTLGKEGGWEEGAEVTGEDHAIPRAAAVAWSNHH